MYRFLYIIGLPVLSCLFQTGIDAKLVRVPLNTAVVQGSAVTFECSSTNISSTLAWFNSSCVTTTKSVSACREYIINSGYSNNFAPRFSVSSLNNGTHITRDLNINPTQLTDAGVYLCAERLSGVSISDSDTSSAQLIVLAHNTLCATNVSASTAIQESDVITMTCSIRYRGNWAPVMRWFNSVTRHNFTDDVITMTTNDTTVTSQLTVTATDGLHGSNISCITYFTQPSTSLPTNATNIPSYMYTWMSALLDIQFAPRNLQITPRQWTYQPGENLHCTSEGNPEPSYQWTDLVSGTVIQGAVLVISEDMVDNNHTFQCTASNYYNSISAALQFSVERIVSEREQPQVESGSYKSATIALSVIAFVSIVLNVVLIISLLRKNQTKQRDTSGDSPEDRSRPTQTGSSSDYSTLNMTSLNDRVVYDSLRPT